MDLCWKKLTPLALINLVVIGAAEAVILMLRQKGGS
jgi:hypothetical protein